MLSDNFTELDGYWFLDNQVKEYNEWKSGLSLDQLQNVHDGQQVLLVSDEKSALIWIYTISILQRLWGNFQCLPTSCHKTNDKIPELRELLDNNFIIEKGKYRRPVNQKEREEINKNREKELDIAFDKLLKQAQNQKGKNKRSAKRSFSSWFYQMLSRRQIPGHPHYSR